MKKFLFMDSFLPWVEEGGLIRNFFVWLIRAVAVFVALSGIYLFWNGLLMPFRKLRVGNIGIIGLLGEYIALLLLVITFYMVVHVLFMRSSDVRDLHDGAYTVLPIFSLFSKLMGETLAIFIAMDGIMRTFGTGLSVAKVVPGYYFLVNSLSYGAHAVLVSAGVLEASTLYGGGTPLVESLSTGVGGVVVGLVALFIGYLFSEMIILFVNIAESLNGGDQDVS